MEVNGSTKLSDLLQEYPFLLDYLIERSPSFKKLENPVLRRTVGKVASLAQVAAKAGIDVEILTGEIAAKIEAHNG